MFHLDYFHFLKLNAYKVNIYITNWLDAMCASQITPHQYPYLNSFTGFRLPLVFKLPPLAHSALSTQHAPYLASILHIYNIRRQLRQADSTKNLELPITLKSSKTVVSFLLKIKAYFFL